MQTRYEDLDPTLLSPGPPFPASVGENYIGFKSEFILDNTTNTGLNLIEGTRGKLSFVHNESVSNRSLSFSNISLDIRNYQKIHREIVFATRLFYGRFFGQNSQSYLLGGMDNWFFNKTNTQGKDNPLNVAGNVDNSELLFVEYVTSLRGFDYSTFYGSNALLFNAEIRVPIVRYLYRGPISSNFLKNLQLISFFDIGSAWSGVSPLQRENSVNTILIKEEGSPFQAEIQNFKNPWLSSYGTGLRTVILGYYMKFDIAWPIENYDVGKAKFYVTLGYDF
jgi:outer membrane protein assembly factor BamA